MCKTFYFSQPTQMMRLQHENQQMPPIHSPVPNNVVALNKNEHLLRFVNEDQVADISPRTALLALAGCCTSSGLPLEQHTSAAVCSTQRSKSAAIPQSGAPFHHDHDQFKVMKAIAQYTGCKTSLPSLATAACNCTGNWAKHVLEAHWLALALPPHGIQAPHPFSPEVESSDKGKK